MQKKYPKLKKKVNIYWIQSSVNIVQYKLSVYTVLSGDFELLLRS